MNFDETPEFRKDVKALTKRVPTLAADLKRVRARIESLYMLGDDMNEAELAEFRMQFFSGKVATTLPGSTSEVEIVKIRLDSDTDQYRNKLRVIFTSIKTGDRVTFIEIYSKNDKDREDSARIRRYT